MKRTLLIATLMLGGLAISVSARGAPNTPQSCTTDTDCPGCARCGNGFCDQNTASLGECMCNAECEAAGSKSCELSVEKPLCGGRCTSAPKTRELICSAGDDRTALEAVSAPVFDATNATRELDEGSVSIVAGP